MISVRSRLAIRFSVAAVLLWLAVSSFAQTQTNASLSPGLPAALVRLLDGISGFTAHLDARMVDPRGVETFYAPMKFSFLETKMRGEIEVAKLKAKELPALATSAAKSVGMERVVTLVRPDKQESYLIYPSFQACVVAPLDDEELAPLKQRVKLTKTPLANERVDGHKCVKSRVIITDANSNQHEATVWTASDLKNFPLQLHVVDGANTLTLRFSDVKLQRPDAKQFELPAGTVKYEDPADLSKAVMKKLIGQALGAGN